MTTKPNPNDYYSMTPDERDCVADDPCHADGDDEFDEDMQGGEDDLWDDFDDDDEED